MFFKLFISVTHTSQYRYNVIRDGQVAVSELLSELYGQCIDVDISLLLKEVDQIGHCGTSNATKQKRLLIIITLQDVHDGDGHRDSMSSRTLRDGRSP